MRTSAGGAEEGGKKHSTHLSEGGALRHKHPWLAGAVGAVPQAAPAAVGAHSSAHIVQYTRGAITTAEGKHLAHACAQIKGTRGTK